MNRRSRAEKSIVNTSITVLRVQVAAVSLALNHQAVLWWLWPIKRTWGLGYTIWVQISDLVGFPDSSVGKESACNAGDPGLIPGWGRSPGEKIGYPLQYSWASLMVQLVKNPPAMWDTWVRSLGWGDPLEKGKVLPTPVFWPGEFHGLYNPWGHKELDATCTFTFHSKNI